MKGRTKSEFTFIQENLSLIRAFSMLDLRDFTFRGHHVCWHNSGLNIPGSSPADITMF